MSISTHRSRSSKLTYRALAAGVMALLIYTAMAADVDALLAQDGTAVEAVETGEYPTPIPSTSASSSHPAAATVAPCTDESCSEGCTSGPKCWAYAKCEDGTCEPTVKKKNCRGEWM